MSNNRPDILGNLLTALQLAVVGYIGYLAFLKRDAIKSFLCLLPGFNEQRFCEPAPDPGYDPTDPGSGTPDPGTNPYLPGDAPCRTKLDCEERGGFWLWLGPFGMCLGGDCAPTDPVDPGSGTPDLSSFRFTEVVSNNLPASITGYVEADCDGYYKYKPPAGYKVVSCTRDPTLGSHGGCPGCIMSLVTLVPGEEPPDCSSHICMPGGVPYLASDGKTCLCDYSQKPPEEPPACSLGSPEEVCAGWDSWVLEGYEGNVRDATAWSFPLYACINNVARSILCYNTGGYSPPPDPGYDPTPPSGNKCGNRFTGQELCASMTYNGQSGLVALTDEEKSGFNGDIINAVYGCDPATGNERRYWCGLPSGVSMCGDYRCDVVMDYREKCVNGDQSACNWLKRFAPDYAI